MNGEAVIPPITHVEDAGSDQQTANTGIGHDVNVAIQTTSSAIAARLNSLMEDVR